MIVLNPGDAILGATSKAAALQFTVYGSEQWGGVALYRELAAGFIPLKDAGEDPGVLYAADITTAISLIIIVNVDSNPLVVNLYMLPKLGWKKSIIPFNLLLAAGNSIRTDGVIVEVHDRFGRLLVTGLKGDTGIGDTGITGVTGSKGDTGTHGDTGIKGSTGKQGIQGTTGIGDTGSIGDQGDTGNRGDTGAAGTGTQGDTGSQGTEGDALLWALIL